MSQPSDDILLAIWRRATEAEVGIGVLVTAGERHWFVQNLYRVRQEYGEEELEELILFQPPNPDEIFICKKLTSL